MSQSGGHGGGGERAVPYICPFCGEEDLRPAEHGRWHCRSCLRLFSLTFHGVTAAGSPYPQPASAAPEAPAPAPLPTPPPTPATGFRLVDRPATGDDRTHPGSTS